MWSRTGFSLYVRDYVTRTEGRWVNSVLEAVTFWEVVG